MSKQGFILWFTGLSGAGKSTLASAVAGKLSDRGLRVELLDGDVVRTHLTKGLGFSKEDRDENVRRIGWVANLVARHGGVAITAAISPYRSVREEVRHAAVNFVEVFVDTPLDVCIKRDVKGLYKKALAGEISNFTGVSDPYEPPIEPEITIRTNEASIDDSVQTVLSELERLGRI